MPDSALTATPPSSSDPPSTCIEIPADLILRTLWVTVGVLVVCALAGMVLRFGFHHERAFGFVPAFDLDRENSAPTWFSTISLLLCALALAAIAVLNRQQRKEFSCYWSGLSVLFTLLSLDEAASFHEMLAEPLRQILHTGGIFYFAWVIPGGIFVAAFVAAYLRFLNHLDSRTRRDFLVAGAIYVSGCLGMEMVGGHYMASHSRDLTYCLIAATEETLEMSGAILFLAALLRYLEGHLGVFAVRISGSTRAGLRRPPVAMAAIGAALALAGACSAAGNSPTAWAVRHVAVFDSEARKLVRDQTIVVRGERIERSGSAAEVVPPKGTPIVEARGKYVIPGLIDAHTHVSTVLYSAFMTGDEILPFFLANGVTAIRVAGDGIVAQKLVWRYAESHPALSPRIFLASPLIGNHPPIHPDAGWTITKPDDVPAFVSVMAGWGVTSLKIYANCLPAVARKVIEEGHRKGLMVIGHLSSYPVDDAIDDGIDSIEHIESVSDFLRTDPKDRHSLDIASAKAAALVSKIAKRGTFVDPTLSVYWGTLFFADVPEVIEHPDNLGMPERLRRFWAEDRGKRLKNCSAGPLERRQRTFEQYKSLVGMLYRAGAKLLVGTDAPEPQVPPGYSLHHEMQLLVESGVPPAEVLRAATWSNAAVVRRQHEIGSVRAGMLADFVILDADPLADIRNTRKISRVVKGGHVLEPSVILRSAPRE